MVLCVNVDFLGTWLGPQASPAEHLVARNSHGIAVRTGAVEELPTIDALNQVTGRPLAPTGALTETLYLNVVVKQ